MEAITEGVNDLKIASNNSELQKKNRIQVSNTKKSLFFYVNLSKRYMQQYNEVELSALGMAISTVVTVAEILKNNGFAVEKKIRTLSVYMKDDPQSRPVPKAKLGMAFHSQLLIFEMLPRAASQIEVVLGKTDKFDELMAAEAERAEDGVEG